MGPDDDYNGAIVVVYGTFCFIVFLGGLIGATIYGLSGAAIGAVTTGLSFAVGCGLYSAYYRWFK